MNSGIVISNNPRQVEVLVTVSSVQQTLEDRTKLIQNRALSLQNKTNKIINNDENNKINTFPNPVMPLLSNTNQVNEPNFDLQPPTPTIIMDQNKKHFNVRCVCDIETLNRCRNNNAFLIQCSKCGFFVHGMCVGIAKYTKKYTICPYCLKRSIRCSCGENKKYDEPLIQCEKCHFWVHKSCAGLSFGRNPQNFICYECGQASIYKLPEINFLENSDCLEDYEVQIDDNEDFNKMELINRLPNGDFKNHIEEDLNQSLISFRQALIRYTKLFLPNLFDYSHEFWKIFVGTLSDIFKCNKIHILDAIDELTRTIIYKQIPINPKPHKVKIRELIISDSITSNVETANLQKVDNFVQPDKLLFSITNRFVAVADVDIEVNSLICELTGVLCHEDEVDASNGIPKWCISIPETNIFINVDRSTSQNAQFIRRSHNFNCIVKLFRTDGNTHVGLYAIKPRGPLIEEKFIFDKVIAIPAGTELLLPLDADIPYQIEKFSWKEKKSSNKKSRLKKPNVKPKLEKDDSALENSSTRNKKKRNESQAKITIETRAMKTRSAKPGFPFQLTLLSAFTEDACPPLPIRIGNKKKQKETKSSAAHLARSRHLNHVRHTETPSEQSDT